MQWTEPIRILGRNHCKVGSYLLRVSRAAIQAYKAYTVTFCNVPLPGINAVRANHRGDETWTALASMASRT